MSRLLGFYEIHLTSETRLSFKAHKPRYFQRDKFLVIINWPRLFNYLSPLKRRGKCYAIGTSSTKPQARADKS